MAPISASLKITNWFFIRLSVPSSYFFSDMGRVRTFKENQYRLNDAFETILSVMKVDFRIFI